MKTCIRCESSKEIELFRSDGRKICKDCEKKQRKIYISTDEGKTKRLSAARHYRKINKDKIYKERKVYRENNKEQILKTYREYRKRNKERISTKKKIYDKNNREEINKYNNSYSKKRKKIDPMYKTKCYLRSRIWFIFKKKNVEKQETEKLLGCSYDFAKKWIEKQFTKGMNWRNQGKWHIDHKIPLSTAKTENELIDLCHYTNLQPLWEKENLIKNAKITPIQISLTI